MTTCSTSTEITLPLLQRYIAMLSNTLAIKNTASAADDTNNKKSPKTELLWVVEDHAALSQLSSTPLADAQSHYMAEYSALTLPMLAKQTVLTRYQLVCFWLPTLTAELLQPYISLIMRHRDLYAAHVIIATDTTINLRTYGFIPFDDVAKNVTENMPEDLTKNVHENITIDSQAAPIKVILWQFNLYDYKRLPNWLNSDHWANPENWDKHRW